MDSLTGDLHRLISDVINYSEARYLYYDLTVHHIYNRYMTLKCYNKVVYYMSRGGFLNDIRFKLALSLSKNYNYLLLGLAAGGHTDDVKKIIESISLHPSIFSLAYCEAEYYGRTGVMNLLESRYQDVIDYNSIFDIGLPCEFPVDDWKRGMGKTFAKDEKSVITLLSMVFHLNPNRVQLVKYLIARYSKIYVKEEWHIFWMILGWATDEHEYKIMLDVINSRYRDPEVRSLIKPKIETSAEFATLYLWAYGYDFYMSETEMIDILKIHPQPNFYSPCQKVSDYIIETYKRYDLYYLSLIDNQLTPYNGRKDHVMIEIENHVNIQQLNCSRVIGFTIVFILIAFIVFLLFIVN